MCMPCVKRRFRTASLRPCDGVQTTDRQWLETLKARSVRAVAIRCNVAEKSEVAATVEQTVSALTLQCSLARRPAVDELDRPALMPLPVEP